MPSKQSLADLEGTPHATVFPGESPRTVRLRLAAGESVDAHRHPGQDVVIVVIAGRLAVAVGGESTTAEAGDVLRVDGDRSIAQRALEETTALVVLAPRPTD